MFENEIKVGDKVIGGERTFIIAEIGSNHNQKLDLAYELIDAAVDSGADAVKFQSIKPETLFSLEEVDDDFEKLLKKIEFKETWHYKIKKYCDKEGILFFSTPTYLNAIEILLDNNVELMKIASPQTLGYPQLIKKISETNLPTLMSTGYCNYAEIERAVNVFKKNNNRKLVLLHCISEYPTEVKNVNLNFINILKKMFGVIPGFSDHTLGYHVPIAAVSKGAKVIEKHFTLSRDMRGPDHHFAIEPDEFKKMVDYIRDVEKALGNSYKNRITSFEKSLKPETIMRIVARKDIKAGEKITKDKIKFLRNKNEYGISAWDEKKILGYKVTKKIKKGQFIKYNDIY